MQGERELDQSLKKWLFNITLYIYIYHRIGYTEMLILSVNLMDGNITTLSI